MLAVNMSLMVAFVLSIALILLLAQIGVNIPPGIVIVVFGLGATYLWLYIGMNLPLSFSLVETIRSTLIGASPVVVVTAAEYAFLLVDPEGCVGAHILILMLGSLSLVMISAMTPGGLVLGRRIRRAS